MNDKLDDVVAAVLSAWVAVKKSKPTLTPQLTGTAEGVRHNLATALDELWRAYDEQNAQRSRSRSFLSVSLRLAGLCNRRCPMDTYERRRWWAAGAQLPGLARTRNRSWKRVVFTSRTFLQERPRTPCRAVTTKHTRA